MDNYLARFDAYLSKHNIDYELLKKNVNMRSGDNTTSAGANGNKLVEDKRKFLISFYFPEFAIAEGGGVNLCDNSNCPHYFRQLSKVDSILTVSQFWKKPEHIVNKNVPHFGDIVYVNDIENADDNEKFWITADGRRMFKIKYKYLKELPIPQKLFQYAEVRVETDKPIKYIGINVNLDIRDKYLDIHDEYAIKIPHACNILLINGGNCCMRYLYDTSLQLDKNECMFCVSKRDGICSCKDKYALDIKRRVVV